MRINLTLTEFEIHHKIYSSQLLTPSILEFSFFLFISRIQQIKKSPSYVHVSWFFKYHLVHEVSALEFIIADSFCFIDTLIKFLFFYFSIYVLLKIVYFYKKCYVGTLSIGCREYTQDFFYFVDNLLEIN